MKNKFSAAIAVLAGLALAPAAAQNNQLTGVVQSVSSDEMVPLFVNSNINARYAGYEGDTHFIEINEDGVIVYVALRGCNGGLRTSRCLLIEPYALFNVPGLTLAQVNDLNLSAFDLSSVGLAASNTAIIGAKLFVEGGVAEANIRNNLGRFFLDLARFAESITPGAIANVSFNGASAERAAAGAGTAAQTGHAANGLRASAAALHAVGDRINP